MTDQQHPITPPPELVRQWISEAEKEHQPTVCYSLVSLLATKAARWGADQELEACCEWLRESLATPSLMEFFLANRRPKPPSLKEQALQALAELAAECYGNTDQSDTIRRALEALDD